MSKIKVDTIEGSTGTTITVPSGQTLTVTDGIAATNLSGTISDARLPTVPVSKGGTGLTSLGSAGQVLKVNSGGTALEFGAAESILNIDGATDGTGTTLVPTDLLLISDTSDGAGLKKVTASELTGSRVGASKYVTRSMTGNGSTNTITITTGHNVDSVIVTENGVVQRPTTDYTISGTTLTFVAAPASGVAVRVKELLIQYDTISNLR